MQELSANKKNKNAEPKTDMAPHYANGLPENIITAIGFLSIIFFLAIATWITQPPEYVALESRKRAVLPHFSLKKNDLRKFVASFEPYFNDRFALRSELLSLRSFLAYFLLHETGSDKIAAGYDHWLYLNMCKNLESFRNLQPYTTSELAYLTAGLERQRDWLAQQHIRYLFFVAPGKPTIYPEFMPVRFNKINKESRLDQLVSYLKKHSTIEVIDLRPTLYAGKRHNLVYYKTDSHWNDLGAFLAYRQIGSYLSRWFPAIHLWQWSDFRKEEILFNRGDSAGMIGLNNFLTESDPYLIPLRQRRCFLSNYPQPDPRDIHDHTRIIPAFATELNDPSLPKAVMLRDSFATAMQPFLSEHFRRILYLWQPAFPADEIKREHPDIVIQEIVERLLMCNLPKTLEEKK